MAQAEDTELRDLVIDALEKNGSLAKIRALLRANVFLAFENECENIKQNVSLDNILKLPEGIICLSIVHEFLEFCNLKNTLFVYMAESRQRKEYVYEGHVLAEKLNLRRENVKEPILVSLLKNVYREETKYSQDKNRVNNYKDDQNSTYIVHEDSSSGTSNFDNSSDERNKLHLRLQLDNSDTDTSSDSTRDKSSSEYIPNEHITHKSEEKLNTSEAQASNHEETQDKQIIVDNNHKSTEFLHEIKLANSSSESTSYLDLKINDPKKTFDSARVPLTEVTENEIYMFETSNIEPGTTDMNLNKSKPQSPVELAPTSLTLSSSRTISTNSDGKANPVKTEANNSIETSRKSDVDTVEYSNDFTTSLANKDQDIISETQVLIKNPKTSTKDSQDNSQSSQSSISISDVADLISEKNSFGATTTNDFSNDKSKLSNSDSKNKSNINQNKLSDDSGDFSESPVPSLSNLSLDVHSD